MDAKLDFTKNKTMRRLGACNVITAWSKEGREIKELLDGIGLADNQDAKMACVYGYMLGKRRGEKNAE